MRTSFSSVIARVAATMLAAMAMTATASARPLTPAEKRFHPYYADLPRCDDASVTGLVQSRFDQRESYYWKSGLEIAQVVKARETGLRRNGLDYIPRRYCEAKAVMNDRTVRSLVYWVGEDLGMTGTDAVRSLTQTFTFGLFPELNVSPFSNWGIDWCVIGLDRNYAYGLNCRAARPQ